MPDHDLQGEILKTLSKRSFCDEIGSKHACTGGFNLLLDNGERHVEDAHPKSGRGERIRTSDLSVPNRAHYQAVLRPEFYDNSRFRKEKALHSSQRRNLGSSFSGIYVPFPAHYVCD